MASIIKVDTIQTAAGGTPTAADLGLNTTGSVLQVVTDISTGSSQTVSTSDWTDITDLSVSITPSSTSSKILLLVDIFFEGGSGETADAGAAFRLVRGSTNIYRNSNFTNSWNGFKRGTVAFHHLDSPSTTSETTYKVQALRQSSSYNILVRAPGRECTITAMEIAG